jgi:hypothetical protein
VIYLLIIITIGVKLIVAFSYFFYLPTWKCGSAASVTVHGTTSQKIIVDFIVTAVRTSNQTSMEDRLGTPVAEGLLENAGALLAQITRSTVPFHPDESPNPTLLPVVFRIITIYIYTEKLNLPTHFDPEDESSTYLRNISNIALFHSVITQDLN